MIYEKKKMNDYDLGEDKNLVVVVVYCLRLLVQVQKMMMIMSRKTVV